MNSPSRGDVSEGSEAADPGLCRGFSLQEPQEVGQPDLCKCFHNAVFLDIFYGIFAEEHLRRESFQAQDAEQAKLQKSGAVAPQRYCATCCSSPVGGGLFCSPGGGSPSKFFQPAISPSRADGVGAKLPRNASRSAYNEGMSVSLEGEIVSPSGQPVMTSLGNGSLPRHACNAEGNSSRSSYVCAPAESSEHANSPERPRRRRSNSAGSSCAITPQWLENELGGTPMSDISPLPANKLAGSQMAILSSFEASGNCMRKKAPSSRKSSVWSVKSSCAASSSDNEGVRGGGILNTFSAASSPRHQPFLSVAVKTLFMCVTCAKCFCADHAHAHYERFRETVREELHYPSHSFFIGVPDKVSDDLCQEYVPPPWGLNFPIVVLKESGHTSESSSPSSMTRRYLIPSTVRDAIVHPKILSPRHLRVRRSGSPCDRLEIPPTAALSSVETKEQARNEPGPDHSNAEPERPTPTQGGSVTLSRPAFYGPPGKHGKWSYLIWCAKCNGLQCMRLGENMFNSENRVQRGIRQLGHFTAFLTYCSLRRIRVVAPKAYLEYVSRITAPCPLQGRTPRSVRTSTAARRRNAQHSSSPGASFSTILNLESSVSTASGWNGHRNVRVGGGWNNPIDSPIRSMTRRSLISPQAYQQEVQSGYSGSASRTDFDKIFAFCHIAGFCNTSVYCYMNSVLQCLSHCKFFNNHLMQIPPAQVKGKLSRALHKLLSQLSTETFVDVRSNAIYPHLERLRTTVLSTNALFCEGEQQDAQEFLLAITNSVAEELSGDLKVGEEGAARSARLSFEGQMRTTVVCSTCGTKNQREEIFRTLSIPVTARISDGIDKLLEPTRLRGTDEYACQNCFYRLSLKEQEEHNEEVHQVQEAEKARRAKQAESAHGQCQEKGEEDVAGSHEMGVSSSPLSATPPKAKNCLYSEASVEMDVTRFGGTLALHLLRFHYDLQQHSYMKVNTEVEIEKMIHLEKYVSQEVREQYRRFESLNLLHHALCIYHHNLVRDDSERLESKPDLASQVSSEGDSLLRHTYITLCPDSWIEEALDSCHGDAHQALRVLEERLELPSGALPALPSEEAIHAAGGNTSEAAKQSASIEKSPKRHLRSPQHAARQRETEMKSCDSIMRLGSLGGTATQGAGVTSRGNTNHDTLGIEYIGGSHVESGSATGGGAAESLHATATAASVISATSGTVLYDTPFDPTEENSSLSLLRSSSSKIPISVFPPQEPEHLQMYRRSSGKDPLDHTNHWTISRSAPTRAAAHASPLFDSMANGTTISASIMNLSSVVESQSTWTVIGSCASNGGSVASPTPTIFHVESPSLPLKNEYLEDSIVREEIGRKNHTTDGVSPIEKPIPHSKRMMPYGQRFAAGLSPTQVNRLAKLNSDSAKTVEMSGMKFDLDAEEEEEAEDLVEELRVGSPSSPFRHSKLSPAEQKEPPQNLSLVSTVAASARAPGALTPRTRTPQDLAAQRHPTPFTGASTSRSPAVIHFPTLTSMPKRRVLGGGRSHPFDGCECPRSGGEKHLFSASQQLRGGGVLGPPHPPLTTTSENSSLVTLSESSNHNVSRLLTSSGSIRRLSGTPGAQLSAVEASGGSVQNSALNRTPTQPYHSVSTRGPSMLSKNLLNDEMLSLTSDGAEVSSGTSRRSTQHRVGPPLISPTLQKHRGAGARRLMPQSTSPRTWGNASSTSLSLSNVPQSVTPTRANRSLGESTLRISPASADAEPQRPPLEELLKEEVPTRHWPSLHLELVGIVTHRGTLNRGHYIAYTRQLSHPKLWFRCDDDDVSVVPESMIMGCGSEVYLAFYE